MKFIHISDLHIGKQLKGYSLLEDQKYILDRILDIAAEEKADAILAAGDIYDRSDPSADAVSAFDGFVTRISHMGLPAFFISGNHDSSQRLAFGAGIMNKSGIWFSPVYNGSVTPVRLSDDFGSVNVYMLPFIRPADVKTAFPDECDEGLSHSRAVGIAVEKMNIDKTQRNVLIAHQFVTGAAASGSENAVTVGGADNVSADVFADFDYTALGHIHGAQNIGSQRLRYCGTPLKYSQSEINQDKSVTVVELGEKGSIDVRTVPLVPLRNMTELKGSYSELTAFSFYSDKHFRNDYVYIKLTDTERKGNAEAILRNIYPFFMGLDYINIHSTDAASEKAAAIRSLSPLEIFDAFYSRMNGQHMNEEYRDFMKKIIRQSEEEV